MGLRWRWRWQRGSGWRHGKGQGKEGIRFQARRAHVGAAVGRVAVRGLPQPRRRRHGGARLRRLPPRARWLAAQLGDDEGVLLCHLRALPGHLCLGRKLELVHLSVGRLEWLVVSTEQVVSGA